MCHTKMYNTMQCHEIPSIAMQYNLMFLLKLCSQVVFPWKSLYLLFSCSACAMCIYIAQCVSQSRLIALNGPWVGRPVLYGFLPSHPPQWPHNFFHPNAHTWRKRKNHVLHLFLFWTILGNIWMTHWLLLIHKRTLNHWV